MKIPKLPLLFAAIFPLAAALSLVPAQVYADTYKIVNLGTDNGSNIVGIDNLGEVVIHNLILVDFETFSDGVLVNTTSTLPSLTYDNGTPCSVPSGFAQSGKSVCNNGRTGFGSFSNPNGDPAGVYTGPLSSPTRVDSFGASADAAFLNSYGDFAWSDGQLEDNFEAIDLTTPEPNSLLLVGTGCLSLFFVLRRKLF
jgi:hypothetical protein